VTGGSTAPATQGGFCSTEKFDRTLSTVVQLCFTATDQELHDVKKPPTHNSGLCLTKLSLNDTALQLRSPASGFIVVHDGQMRACFYRVPPEERSIL
jgi:Zn-dependent oligopeptidase